MLYGPAAHKVAVERVGLDEDAVERRAAELLRGYEEAQAKYEADQARTIGADPAPIVRAIREHRWKKEEEQAEACPSSAAAAGRRAGRESVCAKLTWRIRW